MRREHFSWWSPRLQMDMPIVRYGHWGPALLLFPTWAADLWEAENRGLIGAIAHHIEAGRLTVFTINSINPHAWHQDGLPIDEKARRQAAYASYVEEEVVPHIRNVLQDSGTRIAVGGASFGAFHAANVFFRRPDLFSKLVSLSGFFQLDRVRHGYSDDNIYFNSPEWFVPHLPEGDKLDLLRHHSQIHLLTGRGQWEYPEESERFAGVLQRKGIPYHLDVWGHDVPHDWPTWQRMLEIVVRERLGW